MYSVHSPKLRNYQRKHEMQQVNFLTTTANTIGLFTRRRGHERYQHNRIPNLSEVAMSTPQADLFATNLRQYNSSQPPAEINSLFHTRRYTQMNNTR